MRTRLTDLFEHTLRIPNPLNYLYLIRRLLFFLPNNVVHEVFKESCPDEGIAATYSFELSAGFGYRTLFGAWLIYIYIYIYTCIHVYIYTYNTC